MTDFDDNDPRNVVLDAYPEARPFADLITSETLEEYTAVAREIANKVKSLPENRTAQPPVTPQNPEPKTRTVKSVKEAVDTRDWSSFLAARWAEQGEKGRS